ncbi:uncharacterized protein LOC117316777 isoform X2 [Pecten maximus]|nr:uncharacterized protein LOC117316777 isoform X2 [Pecten maximus]XP_033727456.1 uncharacterized protein LOC117316777 isoform X2 [Pecten maximus]XP_033727463.1 uncharacterized protein LOC117316777 isoform X2 [Pecten maximus]XP_033727469.1 uncharacterized protein LOC117316777 isoform X2 [Pecten maximus]XP_033727477.1 uncharacterized protein LOC117316777 isoform X2 [Pecten maximus]
MEDRSLSVIMELPEHTEPSQTSQEAPLPRPFSPGVQKVIHRLSVKRIESCSSRGSGQSVGLQNEDVTQTAVDSSSQTFSITNMFDIASLSPEPEETIVDRQIYPQYEETMMSENRTVNRGHCRNENAKQKEEHASLTSSTASCGSSTDAVEQKTKGSADAMDTENKTESKSVQFQTNVRVYPSLGGRADAKPNQETVECLSDHPSEGLHIVEDYKAWRPATPGNISKDKEKPASPPQTPTIVLSGGENPHTTTPVNEAEETVSPSHTSTLVTVKNPDYTPRTPRDIVKTESDERKTNKSLSQCSAKSQHIKTWITEDGGELDAQEVGNRSALDHDTLSNTVCTMQSSSISTDPDRQELEKARRRADRKKRKEMRMAAEGYIKEQETPPQEERRKKKSKKKEVRQKESGICSEESTGASGCGQQAVVRLEAERDLPRQENIESTLTFEEKLQQWDKKKRKGDIRTPDCQDGPATPGKQRTKKKKSKEPPAAGDEDMATEIIKMKEKITTDYERKEEVPRCGKEAMEQSLHSRERLHKYYESRNMEDTLLNRSNNEEQPNYHESHSTIGQSASNHLDEVSKERLSQEERRKKRADRKKQKEAKVASDEITKDKAVTQEEEAEYLGQDISKQKRKVKNFTEEELSGADFSIAENTDVKGENTVIAESEFDEVGSVPNKSSKKYVDAGVGPTPLENFSQQAVSVSKTNPVNVTCGEQGRNLSNQKTERSVDVNSRNVNEYKQFPGGHLIGQQYSVDHQHVSIYPENESNDQNECGESSGSTDLWSQVPPGTLVYQSRILDNVQNHLMKAEQDSSMEKQVTGENECLNVNNVVNNNPWRHPWYRDTGHHVPRAENDKGRQWEGKMSTSGTVKDHYQFVAEQDRPTPVGCDVDINMGREMNLEIETVVRRVNQSGPSRPESRSLWSTSNMSIPHSIQEVDETESEELAEQDLTQTVDNKDPHTGQDNHIKYPAPGPREELAPNVFKVDKKNLPPVCLVQKEKETATAGIRNPQYSNLITGFDIEMDRSTLERSDVIPSRTSSPEVDDLSDIKSEVEMRLTPNQTWEEITRPIGQFRPKVKASAGLEETVQGQKSHIPVRNDEPSETISTPTLLPATLSRKQRAHYEKLQVTFRAPKKNLPGAQFWKDLNSDNLKSDASQDLFIKTPFGNIFPNEFEDKQMSPIKAYCDERSRICDTTLDETGYESLEQSENYDNPESLSDVRNKLRKLSAEIDSDQTDPHHQFSPLSGTDMDEVSADPRFWKSSGTSSRDSRLSAEVLSRIANHAAQNAEMLHFTDENRSYQEENAQTYKEPSYAPSLTDRYHRKKEENLDFFRCVSRATQNTSQALRSEEENIARTFARTDSREHTVDPEIADGNLLFFKTVSKYPEFYRETETTDSNVIKPRGGRRSPGYIPDDPGNYISRDVAHQNLEFFRAVARDTSFFQMPGKKGQDREVDSEEESSPTRNTLAASPDLPTENKDTPGLYKGHQHTKMNSQKTASKIANHFQYKSLPKDNFEYCQHPGRPKPLSRLFSKRNDALSLLQPVVSPGKAKENMDFFLQVSKDPHFYQIAEKPEVPVMAAPDVKPKSYKTYNGINVNSGRPTGKQGLGFKSRYSS